MNIELIHSNGVDIAALSSDKTLITDAQSALELAMAVKYKTGADRIVIEKDLVCKDFFILSTGVAGEILQKFTNYRVKAAVYGDYSTYTSKPLQDFIRESNRGRHFFFVPSRSEAIQKLSDT